MLSSVLLRKLTDLMGLHVKMQFSSRRSPQSWSINSLILDPLLILHSSMEEDLPQQSVTPVQNLLEDLDPTNFIFHFKFFFFSPNLLLNYIWVFLELSMQLKAWSSCAVVILMTKTRFPFLWQKRPPYLTWQGMTGHDMTFQ